MRITIIGLNHHTLSISTKLMGENSIELVSSSSGILYQDLRSQLSGTRINLTSSLHQSINNTDIIFIDEDMNEYDVNDLRNLYDTLDRIDEELNTPQNKLIVITRLLPAGSVKTLKSYASKHNFKFNFAYLPGISDDKILIGVNSENDAKYIRKCLIGLNKDIQTASPEMVEYYWLVKHAKSVVDNSYYIQTSLGAEKLGLNKDKLNKLLDLQYSSIGFTCIREKILKQLAQTLNSNDSPASVIQSTILQNNISHNKILNELKNIYVTLENNNIGIVVGHQIYFNKIIKNIEKTGANIHIYFGPSYTGNSKHILHTNINSLLKKCKDIIILDVLETKNWNLKNKNVFDPYRNLNKDQVKNTNHYW